MAPGLLVLFLWFSCVAADSKQTTFPFKGLAHWFPDSLSSTQDLLNNTLLVFGVPIFATKHSSQQKVQHAANILAEYLDQDEDGCPDAQVVNALVENEAAMVYVAIDSEERIMGVFKALRDDPALKRYVHPDDSALLDVVGENVNPMWHSGQQSTHQSYHFDEAVEEILHMVTDVGWEAADPNTWSTVSGSGSSLTKCLDLAMGDWYTYDDPTCDYSCQATEYLFWLIVTVNGQTENRCQAVSREWALCTREAVRTRDPCGYALVTNTSTKLQMITQAAVGQYGGPDSCADTPTPAPTPAPTPISAVAHAHRACNFHVAVTMSFFFTTMILVM